MVDERYQLTLSLQVLKEERQKMLSDFSDRIDPDMGTGLLHYNSVKNSEYELYAELYHVIWIDEHWNRIEKYIDQNIPLESDRRKVLTVFSKYFLRFIDGFDVKNQMYSKAFYEILQVKKLALRDMIEISAKADIHRKELNFAMEKHKKQYQEMLKNYIDQK